MKLGLFSLITYCLLLFVSSCASNESKLEKWRQIAPFWQHLLRAYLADSSSGREPTEEELAVLFSRKNLEFNYFDTLLKTDSIPEVADLSFLVHFEQLESVSLSFIPLLSFDGIDKCANLKKLYLDQTCRWSFRRKNLGLDYANIIRTPSNMHALYRCKSLEVFSLGRPIVDSLPLLKEIKMGVEEDCYCHFSLDSMDSAPVLREVFINGTYLMGSSKWNRDFPKLRKLHLHDRSMHHANFARVPNLDTLIIVGGRVLPQTFEEVCSLQGLLYLEYWPYSIKAPRGSSKEYSSWRANAPGFDNLSCISKLKKLRTLRLNVVEYLDLAMLKTLPMLEEFMILDADTVRNIDALVDLEMLKRFSFGVGDSEFPCRVEKMLKASGLIEQLRKKKVEIRPDTLEQYRW